MDWTDDEVSALRTLWTAGHSLSEIGRRMGRVKNMIVGKAHRLDLPSRPSPISKPREEWGQRAPKPPRVIGPTLPPLASAIEPQVVVTAPIPAKLPKVLRPMIINFQSTTPPRPVAPPTAYVEPGKCRFPMWPAGKPSHLYCGEPIARRSYCRVHSKACYVVVPLRREDAA